MHFRSRAGERGYYEFFDHSKLISMNQNQHPQQSFVTYCFLLALGCVCLVGCGSSSTVPIQGSVTFQNQPIAEGEIIFTPIDGAAASVAGRITQGKYSAEVPAGENQVRVTAFRDVPGKFDLSNPGEKTPLREMYIPPQFNSQSQLRAAVTPSNSKLDFSL